MRELRQKHAQEVAQLRGEIGKLKLMHVKQSAQLADLREAIIHMTEVTDQAFGKMGPVVENLKEVNVAIDEHDEKMDKMEKYMNELWSAVAVNSARIHNVAVYVKMTPEAYAPTDRKKQRKK